MSEELCLDTQHGVIELVDTISNHLIVSRISCRILTLCCEVGICRTPADKVCMPNLLIIEPANKIEHTLFSSSCMSRKRRSFEYMPRDQR